MRRASAETIALVCCIALGAAGGCGVFFEEDLAPPTVGVTGTWAGVENVAVTTDNVGNPVGKLYPVVFRLAQSASFVSGTFERVTVVDNVPTVDGVNVRGNVAKKTLALLRELDAAVLYMLTVSTSAAAGPRMDGTRSYGAYDVKTVAAYAAWTGPLAGPATDNATLTGAVNPAGYPTSFWFEWGTSPNLAIFGSTLPGLAGPGSYAPVEVDAVLPGLQAGTTYYYRMACSNDLVGDVRGEIASFRTP